MRCRFTTPNPIGGSGEKREQWTRDSQIKTNREEWREASVGARSTCPCRYKWIESKETKCNDCEIWLRRDSQIGLLLAENCYGIRRMKVRYDYRSIKWTTGRKITQTCAIKYFPWMTLGDCGRIARDTSQCRSTDEAIKTIRQIPRFRLSLASSHPRVKRQTVLTRTILLFCPFLKFQSTYGSVATDAKEIADQPSFSTESVCAY